MKSLRKTAKRIENQNIAFFFIVTTKITSRLAKQKVYLKTIKLSVCNLVKWPFSRNSKLK